MEDTVSGGKIGMNQCQNSLFKADTYVRSIAQSRILGLVHKSPLLYIPVCQISGRYARMNTS